MTPAPPSALRVLSLLLRTALRRRFSRISMTVSKAFKKKNSAPEGTVPRQATPRKRRGSLLLMAFLFCMFMVNGIQISSQFIFRLGERIQQQTAVEGVQKRIVVSRYTFNELREIAGNMNAWDDLPADIADRAQSRRVWHSHVVRVLVREAKMRHSDDSADERVRAMLDAFEQHGLDGFRASGNVVTVVPDTDAWPRGPGTAPMVRATGLMLSFLAIALFFMTLGNLNQDLGKVEWSLEWLFTFPVSARVLFLGKIIETGLANPFLWFSFTPFLLVVYWCAGFGAWALVLAPALTVYLGMLLGTGHVLLETWLRKTRSPGQVKNFQALFTLLGMVCFFGVLWLASAFQAAPCQYLLDMAACAGAPAMWNPLALPVLLCATSPQRVFAAAGGLCAALFLVPLAGTALCQWLVRDGLLAAGGTYQGKRRPAARTPSGGRPPLFTGILAKDLRLLLRDRNFLVQTLIVPLLVLAFQLIMQPHLLKGAAGDARHAAALAFGMGAYVLVFSALHVLSAEVNGLWMLYTFPHDIASMLARKTLLWSGCASVYTLAILCVCTALNPGAGWDTLPAALTALIGVPIYGFIAAGVGALGTDPLEENARQRISASMIYLYMLLAAMYAYAIYAPSNWTKIVQIVLCTLLAFALWQKVRDRAPYFLDPAEEPPPNIALADGLMAVMGFFVLQGLGLLLLTVAQVPVSARVTLSFAGAGLLVALFTLYVLWRNKVPRLLAAVGLRRDSARTGLPLAQALALGLAGGGCAALIAAGYLQIVEHIEPLRLLKEESVRSARVSEWLSPEWLWVLGVLAAPLFEEFIFRGLVFRGLRRSVSPAMAILGSAAIFAIVHPPLAALPVFCMGALAAWCFERTGLLAAPIVVHTTYNALVLWMNFK